MQKFGKPLLLGKHGTYHFFLDIDAKWPHRASRGPSAVQLWELLCSAHTQLHLPRDQRSSHWCDLRPPPAVPRHSSPSWPVPLPPPSSYPISKIGAITVVRTCKRTGENTIFIEQVGQKSWTLTYWVIRGNSCALLPMWSICSPLLPRCLTLFELKCFS